MRLSTLLVPFLIAAMIACERPQPSGQFGAYPKRTKALAFREGDTLAVYRVKRWTFEDGSPPALQLEYEAPTSIADTTAVRALARRIWPVFAQHVVDQKVAVGILTATNLNQRGTAALWGATMAHFGLIAIRDSLGVWRLQDSGELLPAPDAAAGFIVEPDGTPFRMTVRSSDTSAALSNER